MARARNIKPAFFKDPDIADAGPIVQLLFAGLWCLADREGRVKDQPRVIKAELFPYYDADVNGALTVLARLGNIRRYVTKGIAVVEVLNFKKHQSPHHTERESDLPAFDPARVCFSEEHEKEGTLTVNPPLRDGGNPPDSLIPDSLIPDSLIQDTPRRVQFVKPTFADVRAYCTERKNNVSPNAWLNHYESNGWRVGKNPMRDWKAAVRTWETNGSNGNAKTQHDNRSRAQRHSDKLDEIARASFERERAAGSLDCGDLQENASTLHAQVD
jgi:hypothetical protein